LGGVEIVEIGCFAIAALGMAAKRAIEQLPLATETRQRLGMRIPRFFKSGHWAYAPLALISVAVALWVYQNVFPPPPRDATLESGNPQTALLLQLKTVERERDAALQEARAAQQQLTALQQDIATQAVQQTPARPAIFDETSRMPAPDKGRLADALYDLSQAFGVGGKLGGDTNQVIAQLLSDDNNTQKLISGELGGYMSKLQDLSNQATEYKKDFDETRFKWRYYSKQIDYIVGDDPDNSAFLIKNAIDSFKGYFELWSKISNIDERPVRVLLNFQQESFSNWMDKFWRWQEDCARRLQQIKNSL
jgi:hypothetical protein